MSIQKFDWNPRERTFDTAWINDDVDNSDIMVPVVSAVTGLMYAANKVNGTYQYVGINWMTGEIKTRWTFPDSGANWNAFGGITTILDNGDLLIGGAFAIKRLLADGDR